MKKFISKLMILVILAFVLVPVSSVFAAASFIETGILYGKTLTLSTLDTSTGVYINTNDNSVTDNSNSTSITLSASQYLVYYFQTPKDITAFEIAGLQCCDSSNHGGIQLNFYDALGNRVGDVGNYNPGINGKIIIETRLNVAKMTINSSNYPATIYDFDVFGTNTPLYNKVSITMTSNNSPNPNAISADTNYSTDYPYKAFDGDPTTVRPWWYANTVTPVGGHWLKYDFGSGNGHVVNKLIIKPAHFVAGGVPYVSIKDWKFYGSNDGINFTEITSGTKSNDYNNQEFTFPNNTAYRYYRTNVLNAWGSNNLVGIQELQFYQAQVTSSPLNLSAATTNTQINLTWTSVTLADSYIVKRSSTSNGTFTLLANNLSNTNYTDTSAINGNTYYYVVTAINIGGESGNSNVASATLTPNAPTNLIATSGNLQIGLNWIGSNGASSYNIKRSPTSGGSFTTIASNITLTNYTDTGLSNGTTYYYKVSAVNSGGESANSNEASAIIVPSPPTNIASISGNAQVGLSWDAPFSAASYNIKRSITDGGPYSQIASNVTDTNYNDISVTNGTYYYYIVTALNAGGESNISNQTIAFPQVPIPATPSISSISAANSQVSLTWNLVSIADSYNIKRSLTSDGTYTTIGSSSTTGYTDTSVTSGILYYYRLSAVNAGGESGDSTAVAIMF
jgi:fibronectin type 3 domain-containing protein